MKLTKAALKKIIKEEYGKAVTENERGEPGSRTRPWHPIVPMDDHRQRRLREKIDDVLRDLGLVPTDDYGDYDLQSIRIDATEGRGDTNDLYYRITINVAEPWEPPPENTRAKGTHLRVVKENKPMKLTKRSLQHLILEVIEEVNLDALMKNTGLRMTRKPQNKMMPRLAAKKIVEILKRNPNPTEEDFNKIMDYVQEAFINIAPELSRDGGGEGEKMVTTIDTVKELSIEEARTQIIKELSYRFESEIEAYRALRKAMDSIQGALLGLLSAEG